MRKKDYLLICLLFCMEYSIAGNGIVNCYNSGTISTQGSEFGGVVGEVKGTVDVMEAFFLSSTVAAGANAYGTSKGLEEMQATTFMSELNTNYSGMWKAGAQFFPVLNWEELNSSNSSLAAPSNLVTWFENDYLWIEGVSNGKVSLYDITGTLVLSKTITQLSESILLPNIPQGVYLVKITSEEQTCSSNVTKKLIKK